MEHDKKNTSILCGISASRCHYVWLAVPFLGFVISLIWCVRGLLFFQRKKAKFEEDSDHAAADSDGDGDDDGAESD